MAKQETSSSLSIDATNIGGIESRSLDLDPGINALIGRNATNRTSMLQSIMAAIGSKRATLKSDADHGQVHIEMNGEDLSRELTDSNGTINWSGSPYLDNDDEVQLVDLYAFLLEDNEVRQTVENEGDLYEVLMRPVDKEELERQKQRLRSDRADINDEIDRLARVKQELPDLEEQRTQLKQEIDDLRDRRDEVKNRLNEVEQKRTEQSDENSKLEKLQKEVDTVQDELQTIENKINRKERNLEAKRSELENLDIPDLEEDELADELQNIRNQITEHQDKLDKTNTQRDSLNPIITAHRELQEGRLRASDIISQSSVDEGDIPDGPLTRHPSGDEASSQNPTEQLLEEQQEEIICGVCGSDVDSETLAAMGEQLEAVKEELESRASELQNKLDDLRGEKKELSRRLDKYRSNRESKLRLENEITRLEENIEDLKDDRNSVEEEAEKAETELDAAREEVSEDGDELEGEIIDLRSEQNSLEREIDRKSTELEAVIDDINEKEDEIERIDDLEQEREDIRAELEHIRGRIDQLENDLVESFNEHMSTVLNLLDYENLEKIWIEKRETTEREGRKKVDRTKFDLHIIRESDEGGYQDELKHLSESECEVAGLVVALTGYLVHDVADIAPVMILDSVEMIDSKRLAELLDHFAQYPDYLVAALLPGNAQHLDTVSVPVTEIDWE